MFNQHVLLKQTGIYQYVKTKYAVVFVENVPNLYYPLSEFPQQTMTKSPKNRNSYNNFKGNKKKKHSLAKIDKYLKRARSVIHTLEQLVAVRTVNKGDGINK